MRHGGCLAIGFALKAARVACVVLAALLLAVPRAQATSGPTASNPAVSDDISNRAAQTRALLDTPQNAALLDLLGDPAVRQRLIAAPAATAPPPANPARDTNHRNRWKSQRFRRLVSDVTTEAGVISLDAPQKMLNFVFQWVDAKQLDDALHRSRREGAVRLMRALVGPVRSFKVDCTQTDLDRR